MPCQGSLPPAGREVATLHTFASVWNSPFSPKRSTPSGSRIIASRSKRWPGTSAPSAASVTAGHLADDAAGLQIRHQRLVGHLPDGEVERCAAALREFPERARAPLADVLEVQIAEYEAGDRGNRRDGLGDPRLVGETGMEGNAEQGHLQMLGLSDHQLHLQLLVRDRPARAVEGGQEDHGACRLAQQSPVGEKAVLAAAPEEHVDGLGSGAQGGEPKRQLHGRAVLRGVPSLRLPGTVPAAAPAATAPLAQTEFGKDGQPGLRVQVEGLPVTRSFFVKPARDGTIGCHRRMASARDGELPFRVRAPILLREPTGQQRHQAR